MDQEKAILLGTEDERPARVALKLPSLKDVLLVFVGIGFFTQFAPGLRLLLIGKGSDSKKIEWQACGDWAPTGYECARFEVPFDYTKLEHQGHFSLPMARIKANTSSSLKPVFINPGGPGGSGVNAIMRFGKTIYDLFEGQRDVVSFDPRGINGSLPNMSCYSSQAARLAALASDGGLLRSAPDSVARTVEASKVRARGCETISSDIGPHINTPNAARDMLEMNKAMGHEKLDYWGFSYGTLLGMTFAMLFPDSVGSFVLDGVVALDDYYSGAWNSNLVNTDEVLEHFYASCAAHPNNCDLAKHITSDQKETLSQQIRKSVDDLLVRIKAQPMAAWNKETQSGGLVDYTLLKTAIFSALYKPASWPKMATQLVQILKGDPDELFSEYWQGRGILAEEGGMATLCGDASNATLGQDVAGLTQHLLEVEQQSLFSGEYWAKIPARCAYYPYQANTQQPILAKNTKVGRDILFVSNSFDPVTYVAPYQMTR
jgi:pimeloyl-ACP methyl ester carboxylesterase